MHLTSARESLGGVSRAALAAAFGSALACAQLLDLPSDPELVSEEAPDPGETPPETPTSNAPAAGGRTGDDGRDPLLVDPPTGPGALGSAGSGALPESVDAGSTPTPDAAPTAPAPEGCEPAPVDVVMIIDNSGSMVATTREAEVALPSFVLRLEQADVDYRLILISRHRDADRTASTQASTSICVASPLGGLAACPAPRPSPTARFFQYSIKIDAADSFQRVLDAATAPDVFGLTSTGWLEWLRPGAHVEFVEVTDADTEMAPEAFVNGLAALAPERFSASLTAPGFVFHAITGVATSPSTGDVYAPGEPVQPQLCTRVEGNPDNAGEAYQALSRATGGLRQPICPATALTARLNTIASAIAARECPILE